MNGGEITWGRRSCGKNGTPANDRLGLDAPSGSRDTRFINPVSAGVAPLGLPRTNPGVIATKAFIEADGSLASD